MGEKNTGLENLERKLIGVLSKDEQRLIEGIKWNDLPNSIVMSQISQAACAAVWQKYQVDTARGLNRFAEAQRRLNNYLQSKMETDEPSVVLFRNRAEAYHFDLSTLEYVQRFYRDKDLETILIGKVQGGLHGRVVWKEINDGMPANRAILVVHNHGNDTNFSDGDLAKILSNDSNTPEYCLWYLIGPERVHLLVPTIDTYRSDEFKICGEFKKIFEEEYGKDLILEKLVPATNDFVLKMASKHRFGYYEGRKGYASLVRVE